jgi:hypothetical protein
VRRFLAWPPWARSVLTVWPVGGPDECSLTSLVKREEADEAERGHQFGRAGGQAGQARLLRRAVDARSRLVAWVASSSRSAGSPRDLPWPTSGAASGRVPGCGLASGSGVGPARGGGCLRLARNRRRFDATGSSRRPARPTAVRMSRTPPAGCSRRRHRACPRRRHRLPAWRSVIRPRRPARPPGGRRRP